MNLFAQYHQLMMENIMRDFQKDWIESWLSSKYSFTLGSRQIGKTYALSYFAILLGLGFNDGSISLPPSDVLIISADMQKAKNIVKYINEHLDKMERVCGLVRVQNRGGLQEVVFSNGKTIKAVSGRPKALQGFAGCVLVDEFSITDFEPEDLLAQALAVSSAIPHFKVCALTNADHEGSFIHQFFYSPAFEDRRQHFSLLNTTIYDAFPDGIPEHIEGIKTTMSPTGWKRYYENMFVSTGDQRFDSDGLKECVARNVDVRDGRMILSIDPAFSTKGNPTGYCVALVGNGKCDVKEAGLIYGPSEEELLDKIKELMHKWNCSRLLFDQGTAIVTRQKLEKIWGNRFEAVSVSKNKMINWCAAIDDLIYGKRISFPLESKELIEDMESIGFKSNGDIHVPERPAPFGKYKIHADSALALMYLMDHVGSVKVQPKMQTVPISMRNIGGNKFI